MNETVKLELKAIDHYRQLGHCDRCDYPWDCPDGHGECFDWQAIDDYEKSIRPVVQPQEPVIAWLTQRA